MTDHSPNASPSGRGHAAPPDASARQRTADRRPGAAPSVGRLADYGRVDSAHGSSGRSESVASLLNRLGMPPADLADYLTARFRSACGSHLDRGDVVEPLDLEDWFLTNRGDLLFLGNQKAQANGVDDGAREAADLDALTHAFRGLLLAGRPAPSRVRDPLRRDHRRTSPVQRFENHSIAPADAERFDLAEQERRDRMIGLLTAALAERFGAKSICPQPDPPAAARSVKMQTLERDRRFNWNSVLAAGTLAVILGVAWAGIRVNGVRQQQLADATRSGDAAETIIADFSPGPVEAAVKATASAGGTAAAKDPDPARVSEQMASGMDTADRDLDPGPQNLEIDGQLGGTRELELPELIDAVRNSPPVSFDGLLMDLQEKFQPPDPSADAERLDRESGEDQAELPVQSSEDATVGSIDLPPVGSSDTVTIPLAADATIEAVEFPSALPFGLNDRADGGKEVVDGQSAEALASLDPDAVGWRFRWTDVSKSRAAYARLANARLRDSQGNLVYLRRSQVAETSFFLPLHSRPKKATWQLRTPIEAGDARLELDLKTPDAMVVVWAQQLDPTRPKENLAVAILSPVDEERVAVKVQIEVSQLTRSLTLRLQSAVRLDPQGEWMPWSQLEWITLRIQRQLQRAAQQVASDKIFPQWDSGINRKLMQVKVEKREQALEEWKSWAARARLAHALRQYLGKHAELIFDLSVHWPDSRIQPILKTVTAGPAKS